MPSLKKIRLVSAALLLLLFLLWGALPTPTLAQSRLPSGIEGTDDVIFGPADPASDVQAQAWNEKLRSFRSERLRQIGMPSGKYADVAASSWSDGAFRQYLLFMYDQAFLRDGAYRTAAWLDELEARLGKIDAVLLWQAYPQLGLDSRSQFDFYRQMPGGIAGLRKQVSDVLHARGVRVVIDFNPWDDKPDYDELAGIAADLDADEIMLDTLEDAPPALRAALERRKPGIVLTPEVHPDDTQLPFVRSSWAQWYDLGPGDGNGRPSIYRQKWLLPQHMQLTIRRWDTDRRDDIVFSFFNGSGTLLWDNVFGVWNPYSRADRKLLAETSAALHSYRDLLVHGLWEPLQPSGHAGLDLNRWRAASGDREILLFRNRTDQPLQFTVPNSTRGSALSWFALWGEERALRSGEPITIAAHGTQALVRDSVDHGLSAVRSLRQAGEKAGTPDPAYDTITPPPTQLHLAQPRQAADTPGFAQLPGGEFEMHIEHARRESGCYPLGADANALWGYEFRDTITHRITARVEPFAMSTTAVTNSEFLRFVRESGYRPADPARFLQQIPRLTGGALPADAPAPLASLPVTFVSLEDARAYAAWAGGRLPTEAEWQWAAEGAGTSNPWPWGKAAPERFSIGLDDGVVNSTGALAAAAANARGATPQGVLGLTGNTWEWTESEWSDGHDRFAMLRGGTYRQAPPPPAVLSEWMLPRGAHPNSYHAKYFLVTGGLDRSEAISFRVIRLRTPGGADI